MINNVLILVKIQLLNQLKWNDIHQKTKKERFRFCLLMTCFILLFLLAIVYSYGLGYGLCIMGMEKIIPAYGLLLCSLLTIFFTFFKTNGIIFSKMDYELLMSLPIPTSTIIASRFLTMYLMNFACSLLIMVPLGVSYVQFVNPTFPFYIMWIIGLFIAPLFPTTLAAILGACITFFASKFRHTTMVSTILTLLLALVVLSSSFFLSYQGQAGNITLDQMTDLGTYLGNAINTIYPLSNLFTKMCVTYDMTSFIIFISFSLGWYFLFLFLLGKKYKSINTSIYTHSAKTNYSMQFLQSNTPLNALYKKEWKRFLGCNVYVVNIGMGIIMTLLLSISLLFIKTATIADTMQIPEDLLFKFSSIFAPFVISLLIGMSTTTSVALSMEGKNIWIIKSLPINIGTLLTSKILVNLTLTIPTCFISSTLLSIRFGTSVMNIVCIYLYPLIFSVFASCLGMYADTKLHQYDWSSETALVKQSMNSMIGILGCSILGALPALPVFLLRDYLSTTAITLGFCFFFIIGILWLYKKLQLAKL